MIVVHRAEVEEAVIANLAHLQLYPRHRNSHHQRQTFLTILALMETFEMATISSVSETNFLMINRD